MSYAADLSALIAKLDPERHATEISRLRSCRTRADLDALARDGWLSSDPVEPRLKLILHGSGTVLVVQYDDGWSTRVAQHAFQR